MNVQSESETLVESSARNWTAADIPEQRGRIALVTGANSGLGYETSLTLARKGALVIMAGRSRRKLESARDQILRQEAGASLEMMLLDLASLGSIRDFAAAYSARYSQLDLLFNNAGIMAPPRSQTADGFEMQIGVNHLGHFALTGLLLEALLDTPGSRIITVSSNAQYYGRINFDDLQSEKSYSRYGAYGQSKLANVLFAFELQRRLDAAGAQALSIPIHPGFVDTNLQSAAAGSIGSTLEDRIYRIVKPIIRAQTAEEGTRPQLYAATMPGLRGGDHIAVAHMQIRGYPKKVKAARAAYDTADARLLWEISAQLTGVHYEALSSRASIAARV
jgi:NAD(P)-dependent dehydrogenase (short-subunit alcohol dehydrogenase family)